MHEFFWLGDSGGPCMLCVQPLCIDFAVVYNFDQKNMKFMKELKSSHFVVLAAVFVFIFAGVGCLKLNTDGDFSNGETSIDRNEILENAKESGLIMDDEEVEEMNDGTHLRTDEGSVQFYDALKIEEMMLESYDYSGALADVTSGGAYGIVKAGYEDGVYKLYASLGDLPELQEGMFFEGWVVKRGENMQVISTGELVELEDGFVNLYESTENLTGFDFYVVTSEWDDGDPSPGLHILEGEMN